MNQTQPFVPCSGFPISHKHLAGKLRKWGGGGGNAAEAVQSSGLCDVARWLAVQRDCG